MRKAGNARPVTSIAPLHLEERLLKTQFEVGEAVAIDGLVLLDGPDGVAVTMTPEAAAETSHRLLEAATAAAGQRRLR